MPIMDRVRYKNVDIELYYQADAKIYWWQRTDNGENSQTFKTVFNALSAKNKRILIWR